MHRFHQKWCKYVQERHFVLSKETLDVSGFFLTLNLTFYTGITFELLIFFVCLLRDSNDTLNWLHDRMPAILSDSDAVSSWLDPQLHGFDALKVLRPVETNEVMGCP